MEKRSLKDLVAVEEVHAHEDGCECSDLCRQITRRERELEALALSYTDEQGRENMVRLTAKDGTIIECSVRDLAWAMVQKKIDVWCRKHMREKGITYEEAFQACKSSHGEWFAIYTCTTPRPLQRVVFTEGALPKHPATEVDRRMKALQQKDPGLSAEDAMRQVLAADPVLKFAYAGMVTVYKTETGGNEQ